MGNRIALACLVAGTVVSVATGWPVLRERWADVAGAVERRRDARRRRDAVFFGTEQAGVWEVHASARKALG